MIKLKTVFVAMAAAMAAIIATPAFAQDGAISKVTSVEGDVFVVRDGQYLRLQQDSYILPGDRVIPLENGSVNLGSVTGQTACNVTVNVGSAADFGSDPCSPETFDFKNVSSEQFKEFSRRVSNCDRDRACIADVEGEMGLRGTYDAFVSGLNNIGLLGPVSLAPLGVSLALIVDKAQEDTNTTVSQ